MAQRLPYGELDERVLQYLRDQGADYPALIASYTGMHVPLVEKRCEALDADGLVEPVSGEVVYRITSRGERLLDGTLEGALDAADEPGTGAVESR